MADEIIYVEDDGNLPQSVRVGDVCYELQSTIPNEGQPVATVQDPQQTCALCESADIEDFTLDSDDIVSGFVTLAATPDPGSLYLTVNGVGGYTEGVDYQITGNQVSWLFLDLDGVLQIGDVLRITYQS